MTGRPAEAVKGRSLRQDAWRRLRKNKLAVVSLFFLVLLVVGCIVVPLRTVETPSGERRGYFEVQRTYAKFQPPSLYENALTKEVHPFGTDDLGRDVFTRCFYGGRISLLIGVIATLVAVVIGTLYGAISGYASARTDNLMMRLVDVIYGIPYMLIVILIMVWLGEVGLIPIFIALGLFQWLTTARIVRGQVLTYKNREFVQAARTLGASRTRIVFRHLLPNVMGPVVVYSTLMVPSVILQEAFLSYLGLGVQEPHTSWGLMAADGSKSINPVESYWWMLVFPALFLGTTLLAMNFFGDGLRDAVDPKGKRT